MAGSANQNKRDGINAIRKTGGEMLWLSVVAFFYARRHSSRLLLTDPAPSRDWR